MPDIPEHLEVYLVGGAVRDRILGLPVKDRDWVVVGATPEIMARHGYRPVGKEFPVFLHPQTKEEYALARVERKTRPGYTGFDFDTSPAVTLKQDLARRDLTINAMAQATDGRVIDYFGGRDDLHNGVLRHVSEAFVEDPVRVLRVARFAARYDFSIADETMALMRQMTDNGEVDALVPERVWNELRLALGETRPSLFLRALRACGALARITPEIDGLFGVPQTSKYHPEIDTGEHIALVIDQAARLTDDTRVQFAALVHDLGKGETPRSEWPRHIGHECLGLGPIRALCARLRVPNQHRDLGLLVCEYHLAMHGIEQLRVSTVLNMLEHLDAFHRPERVTQFAVACEADMRGRSGYENYPYRQTEVLRRYFEAAVSVDTGRIAQSRTGADIAKEIERQRCAAMRQAVRNWRPAPRP